MGNLKAAVQGHQHFGSCNLGLYLEDAEPETQLTPPDSQRCTQPREASMALELPLVSAQDFKECDFMKLFPPQGTNLSLKQVHFFTELAIASILGCPAC